MRFLTLGDMIRDGILWENFNALHQSSPVDPSLLALPVLVPCSAPSAQQSGPKPHHRGSKSPDSQCPLIPASRASLNFKSQPGRAEDEEQKLLLVLSSNGFAQPRVVVIQVNLLLLSR